MVDLNDLPGGRCPTCDREPTDAHLRGQEIVLVPCGHTVGGLSALEVPEEERPR